MSDALRGKTAVVTGASRGIGRAVARALAGTGAWVAMVARDGEALAAAAAEIGGHAVPADVSSPAAVHTLAAYVVELLGDAPDLVVNAAGSFAMAPLAETDPAVFDSQIAANLRAPFLMIRAFLPPMLRRGSGQLVHVGSVAGRTAFARNGAYSASKFGLRGMHEVLLEELRGTGVRSTLVEPGATDTTLWDALGPDADPALPSRASMLRAEDVAGAVLWAAAQPPHVAIPTLPIHPAL
ncbi:MAG: SDR family oxidoreductase [Gemmatimonadota bacterium]|nr:SDR family oxidoreductase [Gemmatimonadota bacterium]